jgi:hypothetical protein
LVCRITSTNCGQPEKKELSSVHDSVVPVASTGRQFTPLCYRFTDKRRRIIASIGTKLMSTSLIPIDWCVSGRLSFLHARSDIHLSMRITRMPPVQFVNYIIVVDITIYQWPLHINTFDSFYINPASCRAP